MLHQPPIPLYHQELFFRQRFWYEKNFVSCPSESNFGVCSQKDKHRKLLSWVWKNQERKEDECIRVGFDNISLFVEKNEISKVYKQKDTIDLMNKVD